MAVPSDKLIPADGRTRSYHSYKFKTTSSSTSVYKNSFFPHTIPTWNFLSQSTETPRTCSRLACAQITQRGTQSIGGYPSMGPIQIHSQTVLQRTKVRLPAKSIHVAMATGRLARKSSVFYLTIDFSRYLALVAWQKRKRHASGLFSYSEIRRCLDF